MKRRFLLAAAFVIASVCMGSMHCAMAQTAVKPAPGANYRINRLVSPATGETIYFLRCDNGTTRCAYDWNRLCENGKPLNADLLKGAGGTEPAFIRDRDGTPLRMFVCAGPD